MGDIALGSFIQLLESNMSNSPKDNKINTSIMDVRAIQIRMVSKLLDVCKRNNLQIWAEGGTLLGLIREHGYIPWDDDIDMAMPRKDYDLLISIASSEFQSPFFFQCAKTESRYFKGHSQLRYDGTAAILASDILLPMHQGIFIDIFAYDSISDTKDSEWEYRMHRAEIIFNRLYNYTYGIEICINPIALFKQLYNISYCRIFNVDRLYEEYENLFRYYNDKNCKQIACPCFTRKMINNYTRQKDWYRETIYLPFEDILLPAPIDYDKVLRTQYGDNYMIPQKSPTIHGGFIILDPYNSYTNYLPTLRLNYKKNRWKKFIKKLKGKLSKRQTL